MNRVTGIFKLIRLPNLIIILFTQYMIRYVLLYPYYSSQNFKLQIPEALFFIFSLAFVCMAAGGYIINDYYDVTADNINKPGKVVIGKGLSRDFALILYWIFTIAGVSMGCWASTKIGLPMLGLLFFFYASGLWFYTTSFKYLFLTGNLLVALFIAFVPFTAGFVELYASVTQSHVIQSSIDFPLMLKVVSALSIFSFLLTLAREVVKDMEDVDGDRAAGCRTLPIVWGIESAKRFVSFILLLVICLLSYVVYHLFKIHAGWLILYLVLFVAAPILLTTLNLSKAKTNSDIHKVSTWLKLIMVSGISCLFVFAYVTLH